MWLAEQVSSGFIVRGEAGMYVSRGIQCVEATAAGVPSFTFEIGDLAGRDRGDPARAPNRDGPLAPAVGERVRPQDAVVAEGAEGVGVEELDHQRPLGDGEGGEVPDCGGDEASPGGGCGV